jgi:hypothetical protein
MSSFNLMKRGFEHLEKIESINQNKIVIDDIEQVLSSLFSQVKDADLLVELLIPYPPIGDEEGRFELFIELTPYHTGININSILMPRAKGSFDQQKIKEKYRNFFERIINFYQILDGELLLNYIADSLDDDYIERDLGTERALVNPAITQGFIPNIKEFKEILKEYQSRVDDRSVLNIPWENFFIFENSNTERQIDCNFMKRDLAELLELDVMEMPSFGDEEEGNGFFSEISCDMLESENNKEIKSKFNISEYKQKGSYFINGELSYKTNAVEDSFKFVFDLKSKRIVSLEIQ